MEDKHRDHTTDEFFRLLVNATTDALLLLDMEGRIIVANNGAARLFGISLEKITGDTVYERLAPGVAVRSRESVQQVIATGKPVRVEVSLGERYFDNTIYPIADENGSILFLAAYIRDVTEQKEIETSLRQTEEKYRNIYENATEGIFQIGSDGHFMSANPSLARIHGYGSPDELIRAVPDIGEQLYVDPRDRLRVIELLDRHDALQNFEVQMYRKDRSLHWISINARVVRDRSGKVLYHEGTMRDITERKRAEEAVAESEERYRTAIEHSNDGVAIIQGEKNQYVNRRFVEMFGYGSSDEVVGKPVSMVVHPDDKAKVLDINNRRQRGWSVPPRYEFKGIKKDGRSLYVEVSATTIYYRSEPVYLVYLRDITDRKRAEEALIESHSELQRLNRAKTKAVNHISHELRTPLAVIHGNIRLLRKKLAEDQFGGILEALERNLERLLAISKETDQIFQVSRELETGVLLGELDRLWQRIEDLPDIPSAVSQHWNAIKGWLNRSLSGSSDAFQSIDLLPFIQSLIQKVEQLIPLRNIRFSIEGEHDLFIFMDPVILREVCDGLVKNAIENTPDGGVITIIAEQKEDRILLHVTDSGIGITEGNQPYLLDGLFHTEETDMYASKKPYDFGAGGKGLELLRIRMYGQRFSFDVTVKSVRCRYIPFDGDMCPGDVSQCTHCRTGDDCIASGGTTFSLSFPAGRDSTPVYS